MTICSTCNTDFDLDNEGGTEGFFGIIPVAFCPTCYACAMSMNEPDDECPHCGKDINDEVQS